MQMLAKEGCFGLPRMPATGPEKEARTPVQGLQKSALATS